MMRAVPFDTNSNQDRIRFRDELHEMLQENRDIAEKISTDWSESSQIPEQLNQLRSQTLDDRMNYYLAHRVSDQHQWYSGKAKLNRQMSKRWVGLGAAAYIVAGVLILLRIAIPGWTLFPVEPLIVIASSVLGWMQIKKFNELGAAYTVAAHEIGLVRHKADTVRSEAEFSEFVNDSEKAFSREHTLWIARQSD